MILGRLRSFHQNEQGQIIYLTVASVLIFLSLAALIMNSGHAVTRKIEMQNAVDAAAVSGATWVARGLNNISRNNVAMTQALALMIILDALKDTGERGHAWALKFIPVAQGLCSFWLTAPVGCPWLYALQAADLVFQYINAARPMIEGAKRGLWGIMGALEKISEAIRVSFPAIGYIEAEKIGQLNKAEGIRMYPLVPRMPVEKGQFSDLCHPTRVGSPSFYPSPIQRGYHPLLGYRFDEGPLLRARETPHKALFFFLLPIFQPRMFLSRTEARFEELCRGNDYSHYSSPHRTPAPFLLKGAQRSTNRSTDYVASVKKDLSYLGIAWSRAKSIFMQVKFVNPNKQICSYGQVRVFNSTSFDLFTQDWRVKLVKSDLLEQDRLAQLLLAQKCAEGNPSLLASLMFAPSLKASSH